MNADPEPLANTAISKKTTKTFGVGGAGLRILDELHSVDLAGMEFIALDTAAQALAAAKAAQKLCLETKVLRGLGTGGDPERGRAIAEEHFSALKDLCSGTDVVFIVTGLGGGSGSGISPVLARAAKETGALVLAFATLPFDCEGNRRQGIAAEAMSELKTAADGVICLPNQKIFKLIDENTSVLDTFKVTGELLADAVRGIWRLLAHRGLIEIHFDDVCNLLRDRHVESSFAVAEAMGSTRSREAVDKLLAHPMLDGGKALSDSEAVLVSLIGGADLTMAEVNRVMEQVRDHCEHAQLIMGAAIDPSFNDRMAVTLIAAHKPPARAAEVNRSNGAPEELHKQLLNRTNSTRPNSRFVPPAPALAPEKMHQLMVRQAQGSRLRKSSAKLQQTQLPLEIVSKGRFDKSEPTIHKGEDLDVPTYIRRGVALN